MQFSMKSIAAVGVLTALASTPALAVQAPSTGNSALFITVFDQVLGASVVQDLGLRYTDFALNQAPNPGMVSDAGVSLNFNVDLSFFTSVGSNLADLQYQIFAGDGQGNFSNTGIVVTASPTLGQIPGINGDVSGIITQGTTIAAAWNTFCGPDTLICTGSNSNTYFGADNVWGTRYQGQLDVQASAGLGQALGFYMMTRTSIGSGAQAASRQFASGGGVATWLLNSNGTLTYTVPPAVPLPAAVWLLLSGLAGLGVVGRRKGAANV